MKIYTKTGDDGTTSLLYGQRVPKDHPQIEAVGAFDELNAAIGAAKPLMDDDSRDGITRELLTATQKDLVALMGELACAESDASADACKAGWLHDAQSLIPPQDVALADPLLDYYITQVLRADPVRRVKHCHKEPRE
jgi:ATP:cob(I)alamin adenosyltransferase